MKVSIKTDCAEEDLALFRLIRCYVMPAEQHTVSSEEKGALRVTFQCISKIFMCLPVEILAVLCKAQ